MVEYKSKEETIKLLEYVFQDALNFYNRIAPDGLINSEYILLLHPTAEQQYNEYLKDKAFHSSRFSNNEDEERECSISDFQQDDLTGVSEYEEFLYLMGLAVYDIFSGSNEVIGDDKSIYSLGSMREGGSLLSDFFSENLLEGSDNYTYLNFYSGSSWAIPDSDLTPFYQFVFNGLKQSNCDWIYSVPSYQLAKRNVQMEDKELLQKQMGEICAKKDSGFKPLCFIIQAYRNVYGRLPEGELF